MAGFPVGNRPGGLKPADAAALMQGLRASAPPANPTTPNVRTDPSAERLQSLNQVRVSLEKVLTTVNDDEAPLKGLLNGMHGAVNKLLAGIDAQQVIAGISASLGSATVPAGAMPPTPGPTAGVAAPGMPPAPAPVSPPLPGG